MPCFRFLLTGTFFLLLVGSSNAQIPEPGDFGSYMEASYPSDEGTLLYRIMFPINFDATQKYPLVLFLHGAGERGNDNQKQLVHGSRLFQDSSTRYPAIVVFPQCPAEDYWANVDVDVIDGNRRFTFMADGPATRPLAQVMELVDKLIDQPYTDPARLYVTGLSMGGMGTWELLWRMPGKLAAAAPICGGGNPRAAGEMTEVPIWAFHGVKDDVVRPHFTMRMIKAVQRAGGTAKVTFFPKANHNSWDPAFATPDYLSWMFSNRKSN